MPSSFYKRNKSDLILMPALFDLFYVIFYNSNNRIFLQTMKKSDSNKCVGHLPQANLRNSQSLHAHLIKNKQKHILHERSHKNIDYITVCIIYKKKKIQFGVKSNTPFEELNRQMYQEMYDHLLV